MQGKIELEDNKDMLGMPDDTSIRVSKATKKRLAQFGHVDNTYDNVIVWLMDTVDEYKKLRELEAKS